MQPPSGKLWNSLDLKGRSEIPEGDLRRIDAASDLSRIAEPELIHRVGSDGSDVAEICILLAPVEVFWVDQPTRVPPGFCWLLPEALK